MVKILQKRFIILTTVALMIVMTFVVGAINIVTDIRLTNSADQKLAFISENNGDIQNHSPSNKEDNNSGWIIQMTEETPFEMRYFAVYYDQDKNTMTSNLERIASITSEEASNMANDVITEGTNQGYSGQYRYEVTDTSQGKMIVFLDCYNSIQTQNMLLLISVLIGIISILLVIGIVVALSSKVIEPFVVNEIKQMQFITDASHELKTPLAIISANADLVEMQSGKSEWIQSIRNQIMRMDSLIKQLITLAKSEEQANEIHRKVVISEMVKELAAEFQPLMQRSGKVFDYEIEPGISVKGNDEQLNQLITILLDNSTKHSIINANIKVDMRTDKKNLKLIVCNESEEISKEKIKHLFDRFYRTDKSRSRESGGYGLGLSIAQSVVTRHNGKITAKYSNGWTYFLVSLPIA